MAKTLSDLITDLQATLIDDGSRFTTATCTAAIREALKNINLFVPIQQSTLLDTYAAQREYEITDADSRALSVVNVYQYDTTGSENHTPIIFDEYHEDERLFIRLRNPQPAATAALLVRYTIPHTINGLDAGTESTLSAMLDQILIGGAKAEAMQIRADNRIEAINLAPNVANTYRQQAIGIKNQFLADLYTIANLRKSFNDTPEAAAWDDRWHGKDQ